MSLEILYEDKYIISVLKTAGMPVQPDRSGETSLSELVSEYCKKPCHIITRLDRPVGGISLFARDNETAARLTEVIRENRADKVYTAVVCGTPPLIGHVENYIFKNAKTNTSKIVNKGNIGAKRAALDYEAIESCNNYTLLKIYLETGRHHQIRVQLAHMGYPIYGDTKYNEAFRHKRNVMPALFAEEIGFMHPVTGEKIHLSVYENEVRYLFSRLKENAI